VVDVRPVEASNMLGTAKQADLKLGSAVLKELTELKFLDPNNRDAVGRYEGIITFITDRGNATRAEVEAFYRQGIGSLIAEAVDAEFNKIGFLLENSRTNPVRDHNAVLTRNPQTGQYKLSYEGAYTTNGQEIIAPTLDALLTEMGRRKTDFDQTGINQVRTQAALMPSVIFGGWTKTTPSMVNPYELLTQALTNFYVTPNETNYRVIRGIYARTSMADLVDGDVFTDYLWHSVSAVLASLDQGLYDKISKELWQNDVLFAAAAIPNDPQYRIFTLNKAAGDEIFITKRQPATGLLVR
jgi:hypothetical protein